MVHANIKMQWPCLPLYVRISLYMALKSSITLGIQNETTELTKTIQWKAKILRCNRNRGDTFFTLHVLYARYEKHNFDKWNKNGFFTSFKMNPSIKRQIFFLNFSLISLTKLVLRKTFSKHINIKAIY